MARMPAKKRRKLSQPGGRGLDVSFTDKRLNDGWAVEQHYETKPWKTQQRQESSRLPVKTADGEVHRVSAPAIPEEEDSSSDSESSEELSNSPPAGGPLLSAAEEFLQAREDMAGIATRIISEPEENIGGLRTLAQYARSQNVHVKKLATATQMAVFKDIIPGYRIRPRSEIEEKLSKDVRQLRTYEQSLLGSYETYVEELGTTAKGTSGDDSQEAADLVSVASSCACKLLLSVAHFNFREDVIKVVIRKLGSKPSGRDFLRCRSTVETLFQDDEDGGPSFDTVVALTRMIKARNYRVDESAVNTFLHLRLLTEAAFKGSHLSVDDPDAGNGRKLPKKKREFRTKGKRKAMKEAKKVTKEFQETDAIASRKETDRLQGEVLKLVFGTYLRILKARSKNLIGAVLEGLAKFSHLINQDFFGDLLEVLREIATQASQELDPTDDSNVDPTHDPDATGSQKSPDASTLTRTTLLATTTAFSLLSAQDLSFLALDLSFFTSHLYDLLVPLCLDPDIEKSSRARNIDPSPPAADEPSADDPSADEPSLGAPTTPSPKVNHATSAALLTRALSASLLAPPSQIAVSHLAAFQHRLSATLALHAPPRTALATLALIQSALIRRTPALGAAKSVAAAATATGASGGRGARLAGLWSTEARRGDGTWDPEAGLRDGGCMPFCGTVWAGELLRLHYANGVKDREGELEKMVLGLLGGRGRG